VVSCPAKARIFGDQDDPNSEISQVLKKHKPVQLKNNKGELLKAGEKSTKPNVFYVRSYKPVATKA
jgi:Fe-S-cluster-containing dehydrogenase component